MIVQEALKNKFLTQTGFFIKKSLNKRFLIESEISEGAIKSIRYLKPRIDFTSTKKHFGYRLFKEYKVLLLTAKNRKFYSSVEFEVNASHVYYVSSNLKKFVSRKKWYKLYNNFRSIQSWLLKSKHRFKFSRQEGQFLVINNTKFQLLNLVSNRNLAITKYLKMKYKVMFIKRNFLAIRCNTLTFKDYLLTAKNWKYIKTFKRKRIYFFYLLKKIKIWYTTLNMLWNKKITTCIIDFDFVFKYLLKLNYIQFLLKLSYRLLKKIRRREGYFVKNIKYFFYKTINNIIKINRKKRYVRELIKNFENELFVVLNTFIRVQCEIRNFLQKNNFASLFKIFLNYLFLNILYKQNNTNLFNKQSNSNLLRGEIQPYRYKLGEVHYPKLSYFLTKRSYQAYLNKLKFIRRRISFLKLKFIEKQIYKIFKY